MGLGCQDTAISWFNSGQMGRKGLKRKVRCAKLIPGREARQGIHDCFPCERVCGEVAGAVVSGCPQGKSVGEKGESLAKEKRSLITALGAEWHKGTWVVEGMKVVG